MRVLVACPGCSRHVRSDEARCPFCSVDLACVDRSVARRALPVERLGRAALFAFAAAGAVTPGCKERSAEPAGGGSSPGGAPATATPSPPPSVVPRSAWELDSPAGLDSDAIREATRSSLDMPAAVYGAPPAPAGSAQPKKPHGEASIGGVTVTGGTIVNAARVVASMRSGFRNCYARQLERDDSLTGRLMFTVRVAPNGSVTAVETKEAAKVSPSTKRCAEARARAAKFEPPEGGAATVAFPVTFVKAE